MGRFPVPALRGKSKYGLIKAENRNKVYENGGNVDGIF